MSFPHYSGQQSAAACRYHYNVGSTRLDVHVKKGLQDGLYISR